LNNVQLCNQRQQRILADVWLALKKNGVLIYSTCSYSKEENEDIVNWLVQELQFVSHELRVNKDWNIVEVKTEKGRHGCRFFPDKVKGEGFFIACFYKTDGQDEFFFKVKNKAEQLNKREKEIVEKWMKTENFELIKHNNTVYAWPSSLVEDFNFLLNKLRVIYSGTLVGELVRDKLIPDHALAMCGLAKEDVQRIELDYDQAIAYLQKKEINLENRNVGWRLVTYKGHNLGWINVLTNRVNNYYPKELRILKES